MLSFALDTGVDIDAELLKRLYTFILNLVQESDEKEKIDQQLAHSVPPMTLDEDSSDDEDEDCTDYSSILLTGYEYDDSSDD